MAYKTNRHEEECNIMVSKVKIQFHSTIASPFNKRVAVFCVERCEPIQFHKDEERIILPILFFNDGEYISLSSVEDTKQFFKFPLFDIDAAMKVVNSFVRPVLVKNEGLGWHLEEAKDTREWLKLTPFIKKRINDD